MHDDTRLPDDAIRSWVPGAYLPVWATHLAALALEDTIGLVLLEDGSRILLEA